MRILDVFMALPATLTAIAISTVLGTGVTKTMLALGLATVPRFARIVRGPILSPVSYTHLDVYKRQLVICGVISKEQLVRSNADNVRKTIARSVITQILHLSNRVK